MPAIRVYIKVKMTFVLVPFAAFAPQRFFVAENRKLFEHG